MFDDEEELRELLAFRIENSGYTVSTASGGDQAYRAILENSIDIVISDVKMPNGDGISLLKSINSMEKNKPVIIFTSGFGDSSKSLALKLGAFDYQLKPVDISKLLESVKKAIDSCEKFNSQE